MGDTKQGDPDPINNQLGPVSTHKGPDKAQRPKKRKKRTKKKPKANTISKPVDGSSETLRPTNDPFTPTAAVADPENVHPEPKIDQEMAPSTKSNPTMSPRRQAIMRYKKSDDKMSEGSLIAEVKGNLKHKRVNSQTQTINDDETPNMSKVHVDEKITLFKYKSSRILVFDDQLDAAEIELSGGRLLGHGEFEIFQLHNGDVTYLSCGPSFIYPLLPKLKIIRINFNQFMLPLVNPERYWRIFINTNQDSVIQHLESILTKVIKYRNFFISPTPSATEPALDIDQAPKELEASPPDAALSATPTGKDASQAKQTSLPFNFNLGEIANTIPDTPPSAPVSPLQNNEVISNFRLASPIKEYSAPHFSMSKQPSEYSLNSALASLNLFKPQDQEIPLKASHLKQPKPRRFSNPYQTNVKLKHRDEKSDSSMDSLLDEYEENISTTKSFTYTKSRGPSRPISRSSSFVQPINFKRSSYFAGVIERDNQDDDENDEEFPVTSLSEYNRLHNIRSRRSSRSELYTSESNWMEPSTKEIYNPKLPQPKSTHSVSGHNHDFRNPDLNNTYKQIYKSITQRNLSHFVNDRNDDLKSLKSAQRLPTIQQKKPLKADSLYAASSKDRTKTTSGKANGSKNMTLNSNEVYNMVSSTRMSRLDPIIKQNSAHRVEQIPARKGFASRLFGW